MKKLVFLIIMFVCTTLVQAQDLYSKAYGDAKNPAMIFLHGGPGYSSAGFEITTAQKLADQGFYVIVYDRRGEGKSAELKSKYVFSEIFEDLNALYNQYKLTQATLLGHSFGGVVATLFAEKNPQKVSAVVLIDAPVDIQQTFKTILNSSRKIYQANNDKTNLAWLDKIEKMDPKFEEYATYTFAHAMLNGFYKPKNMSNEAKKIYAEAAKNPDFRYMTEMNPEAPRGYLKSERYTSIDITKNLHTLLANQVKVYGIYGQEDGLFSPEQVKTLEAIIGAKNVYYVPEASHNVFIDQQTLFLNFLKNQFKKK
jgi:proline iminopeptidase